MPDASKLDHDPPSRPPRADQPGAAPVTPWVVVSANRRVYDSPVPFPPDVAERLAAAEAELSALHASTSWRLTAPLRWLMHALRRHRPPPPPPPPRGELPHDYAGWIRAHEPAHRLASLRRESGQAPVWSPRMALLLVDPPPPVAAPPGWRVVVVQPAAVGAALAGLEIDCDYVCLLDAGCLLAPDALPMVADVLARAPELDLVFADEDRIDDAGTRSAPFLKPGWDPTLQLGRALIGPFAVLRARLARAAIVSPGPAWHDELASSVAQATRPERIRHLPHVLCHRRVRPAGHDEARRALVRARLARQGIAAMVEPVAGQPDLHRVVYALPAPPPLVSVIVPTRDRLDLLAACVAGVLERTRYQALELLVVDNDSSEAEALAFLRGLESVPRVRLLRAPGAFNWAALNNAAAAAARGEVLVLLNNDIEVRDPDWLGELVAQALQPGVGVVGAKLLYPDGTVQHAGLSTDARGLPRHLLRFAADTAGPCRLLALAREVWGVTGACMALRRSVFHAVGGLNEALAVSCNDVDLCLRLRASGYRVIWTPWAALDHRELATRGADLTPAQKARAREEHDRLWRDWGSLMTDDPHYPPTLNALREQLTFFHGE